MSNSILCPLRRRATAWRFALLVGAALMGLSACHLVAEFDDTKIERTEEKTYLFPQTSNVKGWDLLLVVDTREASGLALIQDRVATWANMLAMSQGYREDVIYSQDEEPVGVGSVYGSPQTSPIHVGFVSSDIGMGMDVNAEWQNMNPGAPALLPPAGGSWQGRQARLIHPPLAVPGRGGPMHPFLVIHGGVVANFVDDGGQLIVPAMEDTEAFINEAVAAFWGAVISEQSHCPYQQPLASATVALDYNLYNLGFSRADTALGVLVLTSGDDCSISDPFSFLIDFNTMTAKQPSPFDCFNYGVTCDGPDSLTTPGAKTGCRDLDLSGNTEPTRNPGEEPPLLYGFMSPAADYVSRLKNMKGDRPVLLLAIAGPDNPVEVELQDTQPVLSPMDCGPFQAVPGIRLRDFARSQQQDMYRSVCNTAFDDLADVAINAYQNQSVKRCFPDVLIDQDPDTLGIQANCTVDFVNSPGTSEEEVVAELDPCDDYTGSNPFCWNLWDDTTCGTGIALALENQFGGGLEESMMGEVVRARCWMQKK